MREFMAMEYEAAAHIYKKTVIEADPLFRLAPPMPNPGLSYRDDTTWYLRDDEGKLIARVTGHGVRLPER